MNHRQVEMIKTIFTKAEERGMPLWLRGGWAMDARLGTVTRNHANIDILFPSNRQNDLEALLEDAGCSNKEDLDYGFVMSKDDIVVNAKECTPLSNGQCSPDERFPEIYCVDKKEGVIEDFPVRCESWEAMYYDFLLFKLEVEEGQWNESNFNTLKVLEANVPPEKRREIEDFVAQNGYIVLP